MRTTGKWRTGWLVAAGAAATVAVLTATADPALAAVVTINDASNVLDVTRVYNEASTLPDPVNIFTTTKDADNNGAFDTEAQTHVSSTTTIVIAMNTQSHHLAIRTGTASRVSTNAARAASDAFTSAFKPSSNYTDATIAALDSLKSAIQAVPQQGNRAAPARRSRTGTGISGLVCGGLCLVAVLVIAFAAMSMFRRRRARSGFGPGPGYGGPGYGGPGYGGGGGGVNPWVAGGAGAVGGGVLGYELGRMEGEREERRREEYYDGGGGGGYNDGGGNWGGGGGSDADFGGGGGDSGGSSSGDSF